MVLFIYHFHGRVQSERLDDFQAYRKHFIAVFALFFVLPLATLILYSRNPMDFGLKLGDWRKGLIWTGGGLVVFFFVALLSSQSESMRRQYPFSKSAMDNPKRFAAFELFYLFFYYTGWEFLFRGFLLFSLAAIDPMLGILVQIVPSVLLHINHPESETWASIVAGLVFGFVAYSTGSILWTWIMHASMGIMLDTAIYIRKRNNRRLYGNKRGRDTAHRQRLPAIRRDGTAGNFLRLSGGRSNSIFITSRGSRFAGTPTCAATFIFTRSTVSKA
jgi:membrane protease YdiL (CAAX protease family)